MLPEPVSRRQLLSTSLAAGLALTFATPASTKAEMSEGDDVRPARRRNAGDDDPTATAQSTPNLRRIPSSGESIPCIGLGTWQTFDVGGGEADRSPLRQVLSSFAALGGAVIDSSPMYGRSEDVAGDLHAELQLRPRLFIATKVWTRGRQAGITQMELSMRKLRVESVDLMQVHNLVDVETHLETLRRWKDEGRVRYIGVTHYNAAAHDELERVFTRQNVDFVQLNYSLREREAERRLLPLARERGVAVLVNRPFAAGGMFSRVHGKPLPDLAARFGINSWAQYFLKWVVGHPAVTCAIPATSDPGHIADNMAALRGGLPDDRERQEMARLYDRT